MAETAALTAQDDGLPFAEVRQWAEDKYTLVSLYDSLFSTGMKNKWQSRVYIDLFSGPGLVSLENSNRFLWGSPIQALLVKDRFDKYIFCERAPRYLNVYSPTGQPQLRFVCSLMEVLSDLPED